MDDIPKLPDGVLPGGGVGVLVFLLCWAVAKLVKDVVVPWWAYRREGTEEDHKHQKERDRDSLKEAWRNVEDKRNDLNACVKQLNDCKTDLSTERAEKAAMKVELQWRDRVIEDLRRELAECRGGDDDGPKSPTRR